MRLLSSIRRKITGRLTEHPRVIQDFFVLALETVKLLEQHEERNLLASAVAQRSEAIGKFEHLDRFLNWLFENIVARSGQKQDETVEVEELTQLVVFSLENLALALRDSLLEPVSDDV